jgi:hypothetical protein
MDAVKGIAQTRDPRSLQAVEHTVARTEPAVRLGGVSA